MKFRYIIGEQTDPYYNLALEQAFLSMFGVSCQGKEDSSFWEDCIILYLWQNADTIVVGKNQDISTEIRTDKFLQSGGRIARRRSGGGAVYHDLGNLNYSLISRENVAKRFSCHELIIDAVAACGIRAEFNGRNDLLADGRKFSGNAVYVMGGSCCRHGTVLLHTDFVRMSDYLTPGEEKLQRNSVKSVAARVVNLSELSPALTVADFRQALIKTASASPLNVFPEEREVRRLEKIYRSSNWIYRRKFE